MSNIVFSSWGISFDCHLLSFDMSSSVNLLAEMGEIYAGDFSLACFWFCSTVFLDFKECPLL